MKNGNDVRPVSHAASFTRFGVQVAACLCAICLSWTLHSHHADAGCQVTDEAGFTFTGTGAGVDIYTSGRLSLEDGQYLTERYGDKDPRRSKHERELEKYKRDVEKGKHCRGPSGGSLGGGGAAPPGGLGDAPRTGGTVRELTPEEWEAEYGTPSGQQSGSAPSALPSLFGSAGPVNPEWQVSSGTRNLRVYCSPLYYQPAAGPPVDISLVYVRERDSYGSVGRQWTLSCDGTFYMTADSMVVVRPNGHAQEFPFDFVSNQYVRPSGATEDIKLTTEGLYVIHEDNSFEFYDLYYHRLTALGDAHGFSLSFVRDPSGNLIAIIDGVGRTNTVVCDAEGRITRITDPLHRTATFAYSGEWLVRVTNMCGEVSEFAYDTSYPYRRLTSMTTPRAAYTFVVPAGGWSESTNEAGLLKWSRLDVVADYGYTGSYQWTETAVRPSFYPSYPRWTNVCTELICERTDYDAGGERRMRYYLTNNVLLGLDHHVAGEWHPLERYLYDGNWLETLRLRPLPRPGYDDLCEVTRYTYDNDRRVTQITVESRHVDPDFYLPGDPEQQSCLSTIRTIQHEYAMVAPAGAVRGNDLIRTTLPTGATYLYYTNIVKGVSWGATNYHTLLRAEVTSQGTATVYDYTSNGLPEKVTSCVAPAIFTANPSLGDLYLTTAGKYGVAITFNEDGDAETLYAYDSEGALQSVISPCGAVSEYGYDDVGRRTVLRVTGAGGYAVTSSYDNADRLVSVADTRAGGSASFAYGVNGLTAMTNAAGASATVVPDYAGRSTSIANEYGLVEAHRYAAHPDAPPSWSISPYGTTRFTYVRNDILSGITAADGGHFSSVYDWQNLLQHTTNPLGALLIYTYPEDLLTTVRSNTVTGVQTINVLDSANHLVTYSNSTGLRIDYHYDGNRLHSTTADDGASSTYAYNALGEMTAATNAFGYAVSYYHDQGGFVTARVDSLQRVVRTARQCATLNPSSITDARGNTVSLAYDEAGNNTQIDLPDSTSIQMRYDTMGRPTSTAYGVALSTLAYDAIGRVTNAAVKTAGSSFATTVMRYEGNRSLPREVLSFFSSGASAVKRAVTNSYDACGRLRQVTDPAGNSVLLTYNALGNVTNIAAPAGHSASFSYDAAGRMIHAVDFHGRSVSVAHDANARRTLVTRPDNSTVTALRDTRGRLTAAYASGNGGRTNVLAYRIDGPLSMACATYGGDTLLDGFQANIAGEMIARTSIYTVGASSFNKTLSYVRDKGGLVTNIVALNRNRAYSRDAMGRISELRVVGATPLAAFAFDGNGRVTNTVYANAFQQQRQYDAISRLTFTAVGDVSSSNIYDPYAPARMLSHYAAYGTRTNEHLYTYDIIDQVSEETIVVNGAFLSYTAYGYDGFGDRVMKSTQSGSETIEYPNATTINRYVGGNTWTYTLDQRGNMVSAPGGRSFTYDADNNIVEASVGGTNWSFRYNSANQMVWSRKVINAQTIDERFYLYDGLDCIAEVSPAGLVYREFMRVGNVGGVVAEFVAIDPTVPTGDYSTVNYYHYNHRGDVIAVTRNSSIVFEADYDAYGNMVWSSGSFKPRYTFSTKRHFDDFNVYYYGYRWYLPELGRWMQKDPIGLAGGSANEYSFCANNPVNMVDPIGLKKDTCPDEGSGGRSGGGSGGGGSAWWKWPANIAGKLWNAPNTAVGLALGGAGHVVAGTARMFGKDSGFKMDVDHNAIQFHNNPLMLLGPALTLGNTINYDTQSGPESITRSGNCMGDHEEQHTYQGEQMGPAYLPAYAVGAVAASAQGDWWQNHFMERGPESHPPRLW